MKRGSELAFLAAALLVGPALPGTAASLPLGPTRLELGGEVTGTYGSSDPGDFNYSATAYRPQRLFRIRLMAELPMGRWLALLGEFRSDDLNAPEVQALYLRVRPLGEAPVDLQIGRVPPVVGGFTRRYGNDNPLIGVPLPYQYLTTLRHESVPYGPDDLLRRRGYGARVGYGPYSQALGMPLVEGVAWDTGAEARVGRGRVQAALALTRGSPAHPVVEDDNGGKQLSARLQWRPLFGLVAGVSAARAAYLSDSAAPGLPPGHTVDGTRQTLVGLDAEYARGHGLLRAELMHSSWDAPTVRLDPPLRSWGLLLEGRYTLRPALYAAARVEGLTFDRLEGRRLSDTWDANVWRVEAGLGYVLSRDLRLKATYQYNWRDGGPQREDGLFAVQAAFAF